MISSLGSVIWAINRDINRDMHGGNAPVVQVLLATSVGRQELSTWPQYSDDAINADAGGRAQVHLTVLCYFWVRREHPLPLLHLTRPC
jgi:hypothetical protein